MGKPAPTQIQPQRKKSMKVRLKNSWQIYVLVFPAILYYFLFDYLPMYGVQIAFKDFKAVLGVAGSEWVGLKHFKTFFNAYYFKRLLTNTIVLNIYSLLWSFPIPIIIAIMLNYVRKEKLKRFIQTTIYVPHFVSTVVIAGMLYVFLSPGTGIINIVMKAMGMNPVDFMSEPSAFRTIYVLSGIWQGAGYGSILYIATLTGIDPGLYEAAEIDGASIWQKIRYIDIPSLLPMIAMKFIMAWGGIMGSSTSKVLLLQTSGNIAVSDIIGTYSYNVGLGSGQFSYSAAISLFTNLINFIMLITVNKISKKLANISMF